jgi:serine/threonine protein kinase
MTVAAGTRLGPYEIRGLLGAGGMGEVYRALDPRLGREVAVKVLPEEVGRDPERLARFEREARAVAALNHPSILTVHDVGTHEGTPYVVMELLEGETLRELLTRRAPTQRQALSLAVQVARGLEAAHAKGIVHRDLKPENLFLTTDGRLKILDFGLAKLVAGETAGSQEATASSPSRPGQMLGTVGYMSPEQVRGRGLDGRSDLFSLGVVLYELLGGKHPFRRETAVATLTAILEDQPPSLSAVAPAVSAALGRIVGRCLEKAPEAAPEALPQRRRRVQAEREADRLQPRRPMARHLLGRREAPALAPVRRRPTRAEGAGASRVGTDDSVVADRVRSARPIRARHWHRRQRVGRSARRGAGPPDAPACP